MVRSAVSCDWCGAVVGSSSPLSSDGGTVPPAGTPVFPAAAPAPSGPPPYGGAGAPGAAAYGGTPGSTVPPPGYAGSPPGYAGPAAGYAVAASSATNGKAVASLVFSILGFFVCYVIGPIVGIVLGGQAKREIRRSGGRQQGDGIAQAGQILGWVGLGLTVLAFIAFAALFALGNAASVKFSSVPIDTTPSNCVPGVSC